MYEETKSRIDWKGLFLKVIIAFLIILIGFKAYSTLKGNDNKEIVKPTTETISKSKTSSTFTANLEKLKKAGESYFTKHKDKLPTTEGNTVMVTLNELINSGEIEKIADEDGKNCDGESTYVSAMLEGEKTKIKANLVCGDAFNFAQVYMGENNNKIEETKTSTSKSSKGVSIASTSNTTSTSSKSNSSTNTKSCDSSCGTSSVTINTSTTVKKSVNINSKEDASKNTKSNPVYTTDTVLVSFESNGGNRVFASQRVDIGKTAYNPGSPSKSGYTFIGWYTIDGREYNFNTPVNHNITLYAYYIDNNTYRYNDDRYSNFDSTRTTPSTVYTMGWNTYGSQYINVNHTLRLPSELRNKNSIKYVRIANIEYENALNTLGYLNIFKNNHANTFIYSKNGWEYNFPSYMNDPDTLSTISRNAVEFDYSSDFVSYQQATYNGFDVSWTAKYVDKQCRKTFSVNGVSGLCNYGIIYRVTWEIIK